MKTAMPDAENTLSKTLAWPLVVAQMSLIVSIFISGSMPWNLLDFPLGTFATLVSMAGLALGLWAVYAMRLGNFSVLPIPVEKGELCRRGPYRWIRHPMYTAVILLCIGPCLSGAGLSAWASLVALVAVLVAKLTVEEDLMARKYHLYSEYQNTTSKLFPKLY